MTITKATRWRVFAGVWLQSLFLNRCQIKSLSEILVRPAF